MLAFRAILPKQAARLLSLVFGWMIAVSREVVMDLSEIVEFDAAIELLRILLRNGPRKADDCENVALLVGLDIRIFRNARHRLDIEETNYAKDSTSDHVEDYHCFWHFGERSPEQLERWRNSPEYRKVAGWMPARLQRRDA